MATVNDAIKMIEAYFPPENVCMDDFIGLTVGSRDTQIDKALLCLDCTEAVVDEAIEKGIKLIISHHPLIFGAISTVTDEYPTGRIILKCVKSGVSVFSAHTNMDCTPGGINEFVSYKLGLKNAEILVLNKNGRSGVGYVGDVEGGLTLKQLSEVVGNAFSDKYVKPYGKNKKIYRAAVINGSGGDIEYIDEAIRRGATCLITSEIKHHVALYARAKGFNLIETGHYASERVYLDTLADRLNFVVKNDEIQFTVSESECDPAL